MTLDRVYCLICGEQLGIEIELPPCHFGRQEQLQVPE